MSAEDVAAVVAASVSGAAALVALAVALVLSRRLRELREVVHRLSSEAVPLVRDARVVMDQAATEMERVGDVLASAEAVSGTVDSASRLAYRVFANPVVKVLAFGTGTGTALRRLFTRRPSPAAPEPDASAIRPGQASSTSGASEPRARRDLRRSRRIRARARR